ncbi:hypothetical protein FACUT_10633 [Fusarium acutatum]|uniref:Uncharacterized protein n=1 Tax=Fusarium acutatum TaxID=78861 RepID=A0A8H4JGJ9_9HYPO|nr:hypothetical protein FACUT_10633 [Fusarium acutatum]
MAPNNNDNKNNRPEIIGAESKGSVRFNSRAASLPEKRASIQLGFPSPYTSEHIDTMEEGINKRLDKLESFAINTNARAKNAREVFDKDTVVLHLRGLAHQVTLFETQSLNQATLAQILAEVQATNARMDGMETRMDKMKNTITQRKLGNVLAGLRVDIPYKTFMGIQNDKNQKRVIYDGFSWAQSGGSGLLRAASATSAIVGRRSPDAGVTHALSSEDEFSVLDMRDLDEVDFQQLEMYVLGQASVVDKDDGPSLRESEVIQFPDSDLNDLARGGKNTQDLDPK